MQEYGTPERISFASGFEPNRVVSEIPDSVAAKRAADLQSEGYKIQAGFMIPADSPGTVAGLLRNLENDTRYVKDFAGTVVGPEYLEDKAGRRKPVTGIAIW